LEKKPEQEIKLIQENNLIEKPIELSTPVYENSQDKINGFDELITLNNDTEKLQINNDVKSVKDVKNKSIKNLKNIVNGKKENKR